MWRSSSMTGTHRTHTPIPMSTCRDQTPYYSLISYLAPGWVVAIEVRRELSIYYGTVGWCYDMNKKKSTIHSSLRTPWMQRIDGSMKTSNTTFERRKSHTCLRFQKPYDSLES